MGKVLRESYQIRTYAFWMLWRNWQTHFQSNFLQVLPTIKVFIWRNSKIDDDEELSVVLYSEWKLVFIWSLITLQSIGNNTCYFHFMKNIRHFSPHRKQSCVFVVENWKQSFKMLFFEGTKDAFKKLKKSSCLQGAQWYRSKSCEAKFSWGHYRRKRTEAGTKLS